MNDEVENVGVNETNLYSTNCLALTVRKEYRLTIAQNVVKKTKRLSLKIALSMFTLNFLNMFL